MNLTPITKHKIPIYGDLEFRGKCPTESAEQISFFSLLRLEFPKLAEIAVHIRNEAKRTKRQGAHHKMEGMKKGASDIVIPCDPPILIELKKRDHTLSSTSNEQLKYLVNSKKLGAFACYALGAAGAMEAVRAWHKLHGADKRP